MRRHIAERYQGVHRPLFARKRAIGVHCREFLFSFEGRIFLYLDTWTLSSSMYYPKDRVIFVGINKTGSSSALTALNEALYDHDVPEMWRKIPYHPRVRVRQDIRHAQAWFYRHVLGEEEYNRSYVFSVVRNPFDKVVSTFVFRCRSPKQVEKWRQQRKWFIDHGLLEPTDSPEKSLFLLFVKSLGEGQQGIHPAWKNISEKFGMSDISKTFNNQLDGLTDLAGNLMVNDVFRLEDFPGEWSRVQSIIKEKTGKEVAGLPHENKSRREQYRDYYDEEAYEIVSALFKDDIDTFNYTF